MKLIYKCMFFLLIASGFISCKKFLDVAPKGYVIPRQYKDFDLLLNNERATIYIEPSIMYLSDDWDYMNVNSTSPNTDQKIYLWYEQYTTSDEENPIFWSWHYANIYNFNTVLNGIPQSDTATLAKSLRAEAYLGRAFEYLGLTTMYGNEFNGSNGSTLGVPYVTSIYINQSTPPRSTIQENFNQILSDLYMALPDIPANNNENRIRGSKRAVYGALARTYLHLRNFDSSYKYATLAIADQPPTSFVDLIDNNPSGIDNAHTMPTTLYSRIPLQMNQYYMTPSLELTNSYDLNDYRLKMWYYDFADPDALTTRGYITSDMYYYVPTAGISIDEMWLIKAESEARRNNLTSALSILNEFRSYRFLPEDFVAFNSSNKEDILKFIFQERRREFPFLGTRWFDLRRMDVDGFAPTIKRLDETGNVITELKPGSKKYTLQIPSKVKTFNPDMPLNDWEE